MIGMEALQKVLAFTYIAPQSRSVRTGYSSDLLGNLLLHAGEVTDLRPLHVLSHRNAEPDVLGALERTSRNPALEFLSSDSSSFRDAVIQEVIPRAEAYLYVPTAAALLRSGIAEELLRQVAGGAGHFGYFTGVPLEMSPVVFTRELVLESRARSEKTNGGVHDDSRWFGSLFEFAKRSGSAFALPMPQGEASAQLPGDRTEIASAAAVTRFGALCRELGHWRDIGSNSLPEARLRSRGCLYSHWQQLLRDEYASVQWPRRVSRKKDPRIRILLVSQPVAYSGAEESMVKAIVQLPSSSFEVHALLGMDGLFADRLRAAGVNVTIAGRRFDRSSMSNYKFLCNIFRRVEPDIVHVNAFSGLAVQLVAKMYDCLYIHHLRVAGLGGDLTVSLIESDTVIAVSEFVAAKAREAGVPASRIQVVCDPIVESEFPQTTPEQRALAKGALHINPDIPVILMVARLERRKRHDVLISALARLPTHLAFYCLLVGESNGDSSYEMEIRRMVSTLDLGEKIRFLGFQEDIRPVERAADIAVLCSTDEPLGTFILESMCMGVPVIVSATGGLAEVVGANGGNGVICEEPVVEHLAASLQGLLANPDTRIQMGIRGRQRCLEKCGSASMDRLLATYDGLMRGSRDSRAA